MNETINIIRHATNRILSQECTTRVRQDALAGVWPAKLWDELERAGLTTTIDDPDSDDLPLSSTMAIVREIGCSAAPVPVCETLLAGWILSRCGFEIPSGPLSVGPVLRSCLPEIVYGDGWRLSANLPAIPWARDVKHLVVLCERNEALCVVLMPTENARIIPGQNMAGEPRDRVIFENAAVEDSWIRPAARGIDRDSIWFRGVLTRLVEMDGALETTLQLVVNYCKERVQFGRPIGKFQAVQQQLAVMAGHVAAGNAASSVAVAVAENGQAFFEIAAAKARIGESATHACSIAHQLFGAAGFSQEFLLHYFTKRLHAWQDEFGDETQLWDWLGRSAIAAGGEGLWAMLTHEPSALVMREDSL